MSKIFKSEKGASSILVILLLVVLVVFGVAALTTALSNVRLDKKLPTGTINIMRRMQKQMKCMRR